MVFYIDRDERRPLRVLSALFVGSVLSTVECAHGGIGGNKNVVIRVTGGYADRMNAFCYLLINVYALTLASVCRIYATEVWSLETRAEGMGIAGLSNCFFALP